MSNPTSTSAPTDNEASRRMHDYLLAQQRRKEEYWLRKYGKVLVPRVTPQPERGRRAAPLDTGAQPTTTLPPIRQAKRMGQAPMFNAKEPISSFPMKGSQLNTNRRPADVRANNLPTSLPPIKRTGAELQQERRHDADGGPASPMRPSPKGGRLSDPKQLGLGEADELPQQGGRLTLPPMDLPSVEGHAWLQGPGGQAGAELPRAPAPARGNGVTTVRDLQMEVAVLKAIKAREDTLERLKVACGKLDTGFGGGAPVVLSPVDPLVRLFYRLVGTLRLRTLDAVEAVAVWQRKSGSRTPFIYYGADYLASIGTDLKFLDELSFMSSRLSSRAAAEDPFLMDVTADGVPLEEATTCDLRRGASRFSSESLRIRMARKILASCSPAHRNHLGSSTSLSIQDSEEFAAVLAQEKRADPFAFLPEVHQYSTARAKTPDDTYAQKSQAARQQERQASLRAAPEPIRNQEDAGHEAEVQAAGLPLQSPEPVAAAAAAEEQEEAPASTSAVQVEESGVLFGGVSEVEASKVEERERPGLEQEPSSSECQSPREEEEETVSRAREEKEPQEEAAAWQQGGVELAAERSCSPATEALQAESSGRARQQLFGEPADEVDGTAAPAAAWPDEAEASGLQAEDEDAVLLQSVLTEAEEVLDLDDGHFIDDMVDALVASLEEPYESCIADGGFTVAGWEIDRELDLMILGIAEDEGIEHGLRGLISELEVNAAPGGSSAAGHPVHMQAACWDGSQGQEQEFGGGDALTAATAALTYL